MAYPPLGLLIIYIMIVTPVYVIWYHRDVLKLFSCIPGIPVICV